MLQDTKQKTQSKNKHAPSTNLKYFVETYGCQMNEYDSELVGNILVDLGYSKSNKIEEADAIFLNTCSIREKAEETVHNRLDSLAYLKKNKKHLLIGVLAVWLKI